MSHWLRDTGLYPTNAPNASRHEPSDRPATSLRSAVGRRTRAACRYLATPPAFRTRPSARAPNPGPLGGTSRTSPRRGGHALRQSGRRLPPRCGHRTPTRPRTPAWPLSSAIGSRADIRQWLAGRPTWRNRRPSGRLDVPVQCGRPADGNGRDRPASVQRRTPPVLSVRPCA